MSSMDLTCDGYLKKLSKSIYDSKRRSSIREEMLNMIEDFTEEYMNDGLSEEEARQQAVREMGDPEEAGELFNQVYKVRFDWKMMLWLLACMFAFRALYRFLFINGGSVYPKPEMAIPAYVDNIIGCGILLLGFGISIMEKWMDMPMFYAWAKDWGHHPLANSGLVCGIGLGFFRLPLPRLAVCAIGIMALLCIQRACMDHKRNQKEQAYLWETGTALENFDFRGRGRMKGKDIRLQVSDGVQVRKGDLLMVTGISGFTLVVEDMNKFQG